MLHFKILSSLKISGLSQSNKCWISIPTILNEFSGLDFCAKSLPGVQSAVILYGISYKQEEAMNISTLCFIYQVQLLRKKQPIITHTHKKKSKIKEGLVKEKKLGILQIWTWQDIRKTKKILSGRKPDEKVAEEQRRKGRRAWKQHPFKTFSYLCPLSQPLNHWWVHSPQTLCKKKQRGYMKLSTTALPLGSEEYLMKTVSRSLLPFNFQKPLSLILF